MTNSILRNPRYELFAQAVAAGISRQEAYVKAGFKGKPESQSSVIANRPEIRVRIKELLDNSSKRAELSRKEILDRIFQDWELCRKLGQMSASLKAGELMGRELHRMFTERRELGGPGDFDNKTEEELKEIIRKELDDLGWEDTPPPNSIN